MAETPQDGPKARAGERAAPRERSVGEHIFIWIAWALAAAFWGATLTTMVEIFRAAAHPTAAISASGAPGGSAYLVLVVGAFLVMAVALAYAEIRAASSRPGAGREAATATLYNSIERQGGDDFTSRAPDRRRADRELR
jgi:hypothetical protein